jgi:drug/metabolite transporter (DMT)-like permease
MLLFMLLRRLNLRKRMIVGVVLVAAGAGIVALSVAVPGVLIHGVILLVAGAVFCWSAVTGKPGSRPVQGAEAGREPVSVGRGR